MGPKKMTSVTHNATETNASKPKKGLWKKLRSTTLGDAGAPSSEQISQARRQINNPLSQSYNGPQTAASGSHVVGQSFTSAGANNNKGADIEELKRQHSLLQRQHRMMKQKIQEEEELAKQQQEQQRKQQDFQRQQLNKLCARSNSYDIKKELGPASQRRQQYRRNSTSDISASRALANLSMSDVHRDSPTRRRSSTSSGNPKSRRRSSILSDDSYLFSDSGNDAYNEPMYSVMTEQPPPPDRLNRSFTSNHSNDAYQYTAQSTNGNPSWFTDQQNSHHQYNNYRYDEGTVDDSTISTLTTSKTHWSENQASVGQTTISSMHTERTMQTMPTYHSNATSLGAYKEEYIDEAKATQIPGGDVTIVYTDIQGAASLWEQCPDDMIEAQDVYDIIIRRCYADHHGYEQSSTGSVFILAFQNPIDALAFALEAQVKLYNSASWPDGIMKHPDAKDEPALKFKGLRVMIGMHHGHVDTQTEDSTGRIMYTGETVEVAKTVASLSHGGQILTTSETWNEASGMRERCLGRPQVLDCGEHFLFEVKVSNGSSTGPTKKVCKRLVQLVPYSMAFDFGAARGRSEAESEVTIKDPTSVHGRLFPPVPSRKQLSTSFLNAPYKNGRVTLCVIQAVGINGQESNERNHNLKVLAKYMRKQLLLQSPPGYETRAENGLFLFAFDRMANAVTFGLQLKSALYDVSGLRGDIVMDCMFKIGIVTGAFNSMSPNAVTGKAEYFGPIVDRAAIVATSCEPGQLCVGMPDAAETPDFGAAIRVELVEMKQLPNMKTATAIFTCKKRNIDMPYA